MEKTCNFHVFFLDSAQIIGSWISKKFIKKNIDSTSKLKCMTPYLISERGHSNSAVTKFHECPNVLPTWLCRMPESVFLFAPVAKFCCQYFLPNVFAIVFVYNYWKIANFENSIVWWKIQQKKVKKHPFSEINVDFRLPS